MAAFTNIQIITQLIDEWLQPYRLTVNLVTYHGPVKKGALETKQAVAERRLTRWKQKGVKSAEVVYLNHAQKKYNYVYTRSISFKQEVQITLIPKIVVEINVIDCATQGVLLTDDYS